ncbi:MAG: hypothetical protein U0271_00460 [Polyangiaceae bacterium]
MPDFGMMTSQHVIYIPSMLLVGVIAGYVLGARAVRADLERKRQRMKE